MLYRTQNGFDLGYNEEATKGDMKSENIIHHFKSTRGISLNGHGFEPQQ